ncbi:putative protease Do-like 14 isoform X2 [Phoenix dactylifera]|uniref:Protease Do-like 14 isoform X2 n=1 Tax=Phoenix dactylifera TaxID=42345 RepID=A0A8B7CKV3_PHODC|nr:putative protease Do-like 14 isoform X2 [Phoenix dactylifera]
MLRFLLTRSAFRKPRRSAAAGLLVLAAAAGGATIASSSNDYPQTTISVSFPFRHFLSLSTSEFFSKEFSLRSLFSNPDGASLPHFASSIPSTNPVMENSGENEDDSRCCRGCLGRNTIVKAAAAAGPAVVNISVTQGIHGLMLGKSIGSGTIIDPDGTILTCAHVVVDHQSTRKDFRGRISVTLQDGREFEGTVVNVDLHSDIALLKIKSKTPLPTAKLGLSSKLRPGDWVLALGCPLSLQNTITSGIVSCVDRKSIDLGLGGIRREYLQTDCAINQGNSGGPLVNLDGEIVGINIMKVAAADGLSFAVPIDSVVKIIEQFMKNGRVVRPWLGLKMLDLNEMIIAQIKERDAFFPDVSKGVLVPMVTPGSPAERAGFRPGDVVIEFEGKPVGGIKEIIDIMGDKVGQPLKVLVKREKNRLVTLTVIPEEADPER